MCERVFPLLIHYAALSGNLDAVRELIRFIGREKGGHPHNYVKAAFFCCWKGRRIVTEPQSVPWSNCPIQSRTGDTCLHLAVRLGQLLVVCFLTQEYPLLVVVHNDDSDLPIKVIVGSATQGTVDSSTILDILWSLLTTEFTVQILAKSTTRELYSCQSPPIKYITVAGFLMKYTEYPTLAEHRHLQPVITGYVTGFSEKLTCNVQDMTNRTRPHDANRTRPHDAVCYDRLIIVQQILQNHGVAQDVAIKIMKYAYATPRDILIPSKYSWVGRSLPQIVTILLYDRDGGIEYSPLIWPATFDEPAADRMYRSRAGWGCFG